MISFCKRLCSSCFTTQKEDDVVKKPDAVTAAVAIKVIKVSGTHQTWESSKSITPSSNYSMDCFDEGVESRYNNSQAFASIRRNSITPAEIKDLADAVGNEVEFQPILHV